jgi:peptidoglycan/LPS O-acetylase OafA/YrhL
MPQKISPLTSVRFFLASFVMFHHSVRTFFPVFSGRGTHGVPQGFLAIVSFAFPVAVSFFYLLSGYVLSLVYLRDGQTIDKSRFFAARFARLYPLYFVMLVAATPELLAWEVQRHGMKIGMTKTVAIFAANVAMAQVWGIRTQLSFEMAMVLPPFHLSTFALGILLARWQMLQQRQRGKERMRVWRVNAVLGLSVGGVALSACLVPWFRVAAPYNNGLLAPIFAGFIWALSAVSTPLSDWLCGRWPLTLGNSSYALYLIHTPMLALFQHFQWVTHAFYPVYLALCIGLSVLSFHYFETPVRLWFMESFHAHLTRNTPRTISACPHRLQSL